MTWLRRALIGFAYLLLYLAADQLAPTHLEGGNSLQAWNAAPALSFGFAARFGPFWLPLTFAAPLLSCLLDGSLLSLPLPSLLNAMAQAAGAAIACFTLRPRIDQPSQIKRLKGVFLFFSATVAASLVLALAQGSGEMLRQATDTKPVLALAGGAFLAHLVAIGSLAPLFLVLKRQKGRVRFHISISAEIVLQALALTVIAWEVFGQFINAEIHFFYLLFLPFAWIATRHGQKGAALALFAIYLAPLITDILFGHSDHVIVEMQIRMLVLAVTSLLLGAMVSEKRLAEIEMQARQTELAHFQRMNIGWEMASALAHEINQPLTAAMNLTQAALRLLKSPSPDLERTQSVMRMSVDKIERVGQIIHGLRDFMRKGEMTLSRNAMSDLADEALRLVEAEANAAGISLKSLGLQGLPPIIANKTQIEQVLINLTRNAVQSLSLAKTPDPVVLVSGKLEGDVVQISVSDNGPGLSAEVLGRLFEPFVTTKPSGMGLGLSICKSILEAHEGRLWAENVPQGGAIFHFTLPLAECEAPNG
ncbi:MAG: MASE1 domain-containing protein [Alphaproteobacteria bacterium]|nr:MASE1 domain-containing protein [Alphaproteobacteria bacterium]